MRPPLPLSPEEEIRERPGVRIGSEHEATIAVARCPSCLGLRTITYRNRDTAALCPDCRRGQVVPREAFRAWWLERFSADECAVMARAIWRPEDVTL